MAKKSTHEQWPNDAHSFEAVMIRADETYDPGLIRFRRAMQDSERVMNNSSDDLEAQGILAELNEQWPFHGKDVVLSGKVYLSDEDEELEIGDFIPESWGEQKRDAWGAYYEVENETLTSMGVADIRSSETNDKKSVIAFVYGFSTEDDDPTFFVKPTDVYAVQYPHPTYEASKAHLRLQYPELLAEINRFVRPATYDFTRLNQTLQMLASGHPEIFSNIALNSWVSTYINGRVRFDQDSSYGFVVQGEMTVPDEFGEDEKYIIEEPYGFDARISHINFGHVTEGDEGESHRASVYYSLILPSGISTKHEYSDSQATLPASSVISIEPRRPIISVAEQLRQARLERARPVIARLGLLKLSPEAFEETDYIDTDNDVERAISEAQANEERWEGYEQRLKTVIDRVRRLRAAHFPSAESARSAASSLAADMNVMLQPDDLFYRTTLSVYGEGVGVPFVRAEQVIDDDRQRVTFSVDRSLTRPGRAVDIIGRYQGLYASAEETDDETFLPQIHMLIGYSQDNPPIPMMALDNISLLSASLTQTGMVRMDGTSGITIVGLERARQQRRALETLAALHGAQYEKKVIAKLNQAIHAELPDRKVVLRDLSILRSIEHALMSTNHPNEVADAIRAIIGDSRRITISGKVITSDGNAIGVENLPAYSIDVVPSTHHMDGDTPSLVIRHDDDVSPFADPGRQSPLLYAPLRTITAFHY